MISEQIAIQDSTTRPTASTWRVVAVSVLKAAILTFTSRVMRAIHGFVKAPMLPYAALFEAEMLLGMRRKREYFEPDPFATERPSSMTGGRASDHLAQNLRSSGWHTLSRVMATTRTTRL